jgi:hypothetical protein
VTHHPAVLLLIGALCLFGGLPQQTSQTPPNEELWEAARAGDVARVQTALDRGADVNAKARYDMTALAFASDKGHLDVVRLLLERGAQVNGQDTFYKIRAVDLALQNGHRAVARLLLERGSLGASGALMTGLQADDAALVKQALSSSELTAANLNSALGLAKKLGRTEAAAAIGEKLAALPAPAAPTVTIERPVLESYAGSYRSESGFSVTVAISGQSLSMAVPGQPSLTLIPTSQTSFKVAEVDGLAVSFAGRGGMTERMTVVQNNNTTVLQRVTAEAAAAKPGPAATAPPTPTPATSPAAPARRTASRPWPAFRGQNAAGNGDGQGAVTEWNVAAGSNVRWKTPVPGIAISSPIVWGDRVFVTTAVGSAADKTFRTGLYGDVKPVDDRRQTGRSRVRIYRSAGRLGSQWRSTVDAENRRHRQRLVPRSFLPVGPLELANHLPRLGDPAGGRAKGIVRRRLRPVLREGTLAHAAGGNPDVGHADSVFGERARRARHEWHQDPWLRSSNRQTTVDPRTELRGDGWYTGRW